MAFRWKALRRTVAAALGALLIGSAVAVGAMVAVAHMARPDPGPCNDTVEVPMRVSSACAAPRANSALVLGAGALAGSAAATGVVILTKRLDGTRFYGRDRQARVLI